MALTTLSVPDWPEAGETALSPEQLAAASTAMSNNRIRETGGINIVYLRVAEKVRLLSCSTERGECTLFAGSERLFLCNYCGRPAIDAKGL